ncbi:MAG TPA: L-seryl-tRNA(Sec) selenium transferase, partial [Ktedonobacterales bacterium]|nr:L-seryl-tRNA(Sec) selenium transferase [Ktedonobacterales bacterium]
MASGRRPEPARNDHDERDERDERDGPPAPLRRLPSVDALVRAFTARTAGDGETVPTATAVTSAARAVIGAARAAVQSGATPPAHDDLLARLRERLETADRPHLKRVINATGVVVNTNLGRAPLSEAAVRAMAEVARGYSNLEYDLEAGTRGSRQAHVRDPLRALTGAEDALAVNNNAAAVLVALAALAAGREVIVSRGELVEIGGGFRVPDVMRQSGARLVEVGTTNRTRARDYAEAITAETALLLAVHPSNFRVVGFTETPPLAALAALARERGIALMYDLGSGSLGDTARWGLAHEPTPRESIAAGADVVCFSGDKLLGGPQAGLIVGRAALLERIARHPLMRAVRIDKLTLAALEATLRQHAQGVAEREVPVWHALASPLNELRQRAEAWAGTLRAHGLVAAAVEGESTVGGGSLPGETLPAVLCAIQLGDAAGPAQSEM